MLSVMAKKGLSCVDFQQSKISKHIHLAFAKVNSQKVREDSENIGLCLTRSLVIDIHFIVKPSLFDIFVKNIKDWPASKNYLH